MTGIATQQRIRRLAVFFLFILFGFMAVAGGIIVSQQRNLLISQEQKRANLEIDLIGEFLTESFLKRDYAAMTEFLRDWSEKREHIVSMAAGLKSGFKFLDYQRKTPAEKTMLIERRLTFPNGNYLNLTITGDLAAIEAVSTRLSVQLLGIFALIITLLGAALWITLRKVALVPMEADLEHAEKENLRLGAELEITRRLQQMVLPKAEELARIQELDIAGFMEPAAEVGGDYYDVLQHEGRVKIGIGDVTGHGLESGVLMLMVQMAVRTLLVNNVTDPKAFMNTLNRALFDNVKRMESDKNLTLSLLDYENGALRITGQHEELLVVRKGGKIERMDTFELGFMVGLEENIAPFISCSEVLLSPGDGVVLYTDGITEARNAGKEMYGLERLCACVSRHWDKSAGEVKQAILDDLYAYVREAEFLDDITLLVVKQKQNT